MEKDEIKEETPETKPEEKVEEEKTSEATSKTEKPQDEPTKKEKKNKYKEQVEALEAELAKQKNEYLKVYAEMENTKRRLKEESIKDRKYASQNVVSELINPIDMLVKILSMDSANPEVQNYCFGFKMITNQIVDILKHEGLNPIETKINDQFDPKFMQAVETVPGEEDNKIVEIMQNGYLYKDRVIRPAMVKVSKKEVVEEAKADATEDKTEEIKEII